jgi:hypothetical protein
MIFQPAMELKKPEAFFSHYPVKPPSWSHEIIIQNPMENANNIHKNIHLPKKISKKISLGGRIRALVHLKNRRGWLYGYIN